MKLIVVLALTIFLTTGCASNRSKFSCKPGIGLGCVSVREVYDKFHNGELDSNNKKSNKRMLKRRGKVNTPLTSAQVRPIVVSSKAPVYKGPKVMRIWLGPWVDKHGVYHDQSYIYKVVEKGRWLNNPSNPSKATIKNTFYSNLNPDNRKLINYKKKYDSSVSKFE